MRYTFEEVLQFAKDELTTQQIEHLIQQLNNVWIEKERESVNKDVEARLRHQRNA